MLAAIWFSLAAVMLVIYVVMDGFDFGAGALHLAVARRNRERRQVLAAIGPFWDGNEVWLLAAGGVLFLAFPKVLGSGLSGFYLAIFFFLWVLILRGVAIELRSHLDDAMWRAFWDGAFTVASILAPVLLGAALGNVLRGVPVNEDGWFALPLFDSFLPSAGLGLLDWYTVLCGLTALAALTHHGALFLVWKTDGEVRRRSLAAFLGSSAFLLGLLAAAAASVYPTWLPSTLDPSWSLTAANAASAAGSLRVGLYWWPAGLVLAIGYFAVLFHLHRGKAHAAAPGEGY
jgi:cytochrome d ubiquinol oxidase subunit II